VQIDEINFQSMIIKSLKWELIERKCVFIDMQLVGNQGSA